MQTRTSLSTRRAVSSSTPPPQALSSPLPSLLKAVASLQHPQEAWVWALR